MVFINHAINTSHLQWAIGYTVYTHTRKKRTHDTHNDFLIIADLLMLKLGG